MINRSFDTQPAFGGTLDDLSLELFKLTYLPTAIDREVLRANGREFKQQLSYNAGVLLFGENPRFYLSGGYVQYVKFRGEF